MFETSLSYIPVPRKKRVIRERANVKKSINLIVEQRRLTYYGGIQRMSNERRPRINVIRLVAGKEVGLAELGGRM